MSRVLTRAKLRRQRAQVRRADRLYLLAIDDRVCDRTLREAERPGEELGALHAELEPER